jgi:hypothetical protein
MKTILTIFIAILIANSTVSQTNAYQQLIGVNSTWQIQTDVNNSLMTEPANPLSEQQLIQFHLQEVEKLLRNRTVNNQSIAQQQQRAKLLDVLHQYWVAGKFPQNTLHQNRQPYFIDDFNTYCAVGYLLKQSGADAVAQEIHRTQNYAYLADIHHPELMKWVQQSGFSFDELALIQPAYGDEYPCYISEIHYNNVGTDVNEYLEIMQPGFYSTIMGALNFDSAFLYNQAGDLYKKIARNQMTKVGTYHDTIFYYSFVNGDTLADFGSIDLVNTSSITPTKIFNLTYNNDSVITTSFSGPFWKNFRKNFATVENNTTAIGNSLNFCGSYANRNVIINSATIGYKNPCVITPVNLSTFSGKLIENKVELNWQTLTEINNKSFEIERSSDGKTFSTIGSVTAKKTSSANDYYFVDSKPNYLNHYRLKQIDNDGKYSYSKIFFVKVSVANPLQIVSNPAKNTLSINIALEDAKLNQLVLYDLYGKKINNFKPKQGNQQLNIQGLSAGKYLLQLQTINSEVYQQAVIIL